MGQKRRKRRRGSQHKTFSKAWWTQNVGGMPVWAAVASFSAIAMGLGVVLLIRPVEPAPAAATTAPITRTATPTPTPTLEPRPDMAAVRAQIDTANTLTVSVLGDSTGNDGNEWVAGWARHLADEGATVTLHTVNPTTREYDSTLTFGEGDRQIVIWNGALPGRPADAAIPMFDELQPEKPSVMIFNFGHNPGKISTGAALERLTEAADAKWEEVIPTVAMLQNPAHGDSEQKSNNGRESVKDWADEYSVPTVDVHSAFLEDPDWASKFMNDTVHPNTEGSKVWTEVVISALG